MVKPRKPTPEQQNPLRPGAIAGGVDGAGPGRPRPRSAGRSRTPPVLRVLAVKHHRVGLNLAAFLRFNRVGEAMCSLAAEGQPIKAYMC